MYRCFAITLLGVVLLSGTASADLGFDRLIANGVGRSWYVINRDFTDVARYHSATSLRLLTVAGDGKTDDLITFELTHKEDFVKGVGWDESKTVQYTGSGLIKSIAKGRVNFEIYIEPGNGASTVTLQAHYHAGNGTSDSDDRIIIEDPDFPLEVPIDPCIEYDIAVEQLTDGGIGF